MKKEQVIENRKMNTARLIEYFLDMGISKTELTQKQMINAKNNKVPALSMICDNDSFSDYRQIFHYAQNNGGDSFSYKKIDDNTYILNITVNDKWN